MRRLALALLFAAVVAPLPFTGQASPRAAIRDWSQTVAMTPQGGMRMGNPAARVRLVEYGSLACPHCRHFAQTGYPALVNRYVRTGRVSYEFRNMLLNGPDLAASLLARCGGPASFFPRAAAIFATQPQWQRRLDNISEADQAILDLMNDRQRVVRYAQLSGMIDVMGSTGMAAAEAKACLTNSAEADRLAQMTQAADDAGVHGTPTFFINAKVAKAASWEELEPLIRRAGG